VLAARERGAGTVRWASIREPARSNIFFSCQRFKDKKELANTALKALMVGVDGPRLHSCEEKLAMMSARGASAAEPSLP